MDATLTRKDVVPMVLHRKHTASHRGTRGRTTYVGKKTSFPTNPHRNRPMKRRAIEQSLIVIRRESGGLVGKDSFRHPLFIVNPVDRIQGLGATLDAIALYKERNAKSDFSYTLAP